MKMLLSTSDQGEVKQAQRKLFEAGIRCEVRHNSVAQFTLGASSDPELWIKDDGDALKALRLLGARRAR